MGQSGIRHLVLVLGDQLHRESAVFAGFDAERDAVWMAEVDAEVRGAHQHRAVFFLSAMRHFAAELEQRGFEVRYHALTTEPLSDRGRSFEAVLSAELEATSVDRLKVVLPGDFGVLDQLERVAEQFDVPLDVVRDEHFHVQPEDFRQWSEGRKTIVLEHFYRKLRRDFGVLMDDGRPVGGDWNFDQDNRKTFGRSGPPDDLRPLPTFEPDVVTREVIDLVAHRFVESPGDASTFSLPVTPRDARAQLDAFIEHALPRFGDFQDAMAEGDAVLFHSRLSALLNVKLLDPRDCVDAAVGAYEAGNAPINAVEGFVRQILGWRELIRGIYWTHMPEYAELNALECDDRPVPQFFWDGETDMACVADSMRQLLALGYAHHIHRLMVFGLFAQLYGTHPYDFHRWHMAMYVDAVDWVSLPNTLGMSQFGDGGIVGTKPYVATGKYIDRMGPYCRACRYDPKKAEGEDACPFTTLYWDFLDRHRERFRSNRRMTMQLKNLQRKDDAELERIRRRARGLKAAVSRGDRI
jgi:deoxyribodipyrimidine photolyase-related protein